MNDAPSTVAGVAEELAAFLTERYADSPDIAEAVVGPVLNDSRVLVFRRDGIILTVDVASAEVMPL